MEMKMNKAPELHSNWISLKDELEDDKFLGWFRHSVEQNGYYLDIYRFWLESFDEYIKLTPENLHYGIFHHCLDKEALELSNGNINISSLRTISLYCENAPTFRREGALADGHERASRRLEVQSEIAQLPEYLFLLKNVIHGILEPSEAEMVSGGVLSSTIL